MLALVHTLTETASSSGCSRLEETMQRAVQHGYRFFYASDTGADWQTLPSYLDKQIAFLTKGPSKACSAATRP